MRKKQQRFHEERDDNAVAMTALPFVDLYEQCFARYTRFHVAAKIEVRRRAREANVFWDSDLENVITHQVAMWASERYRQLQEEDAPSVRPAKRPNARADWLYVESGVSLKKFALTVFHSGWDFCDTRKLMRMSAMQVGNLLQDLIKRSPSFEDFTIPKQNSVKMIRDAYEAWVKVNA